MRPAIPILMWYWLLMVPIIASLVVYASWLSGAIVMIAAAVISVIAGRSISRVVHENRRLSGALVEVDKMKKDFISHVSHELKAPLALMQETTHLILERIPGPLTAKQERLLKLNMQSGKRLAVMIGNMLDLSKLEAGIVDYEMQVQDIVKIAQGVLVELTPQASEKSLQLITEIPDQPMMVMCDPNRMVQIFANLMDNAMRFSAKGGVVRVHINALRYPPKQISRLPSSAEGYVLIAISDSGPGIEDTHKERVFQTFHQVKQGKKTLGQSLGVGLAISHALVDAHKGAIWIEDNPNGGSIFFMLLPKAPHKSGQFPIPDSQFSSEREAAPRAGRAAASDEN